MADDVAIFSGRATQVISSSAGYIYLNETQDVELKSKPVVHKLKPTGQENQFGSDYTYKSILNRSDTALLTAISESWDEQVDVWIYGANSAHKIENVFLKVAEKRVYKKGKAIHELSLGASTNNLNNIIGYTPNLAAKTGSFQNDTNTDGLADGLQYAGSGTPEVVTGTGIAFEVGNLQKITNFDSASLVIYEKEWPLQGEHIFNVSYDIKTVGGTTVTTKLTVLDEVGGSILAEYSQDDVVSGNAENRLASRFRTEITASGGAVKVDIAINSTTNMWIDNFNLSLRHDFQHRDH